MPALVSSVGAGLSPALLALLTPLRLFIAAIIIVPIALWIKQYPLAERALPYRNLPGPKPTSGVFGSLVDLSKTPVGVRYRQMADKYGTTLRFRALLGRWRIVSMDPVALSYVLRHTGQWNRHPSFNALIYRISGEGVLCVEDEPHRRQRRVLNSAFNGTSVNNMMPMFWEEAYNLRENLNQIIDKSGGSEKDGVTRIDMLQAYIRTALDVIGRAGFNYHFKSHDDGTVNPLGAAFNDMVNVGLENKTIAMIQQVFPSALNWPTKNRFTMDRSRKVVDGIGREIVAERKAEIARDHISLEKGDYEGRDVISLCLRANMLANERDRMTDDEVLGQIGALMLAGNETSATALSWATLHLTERPDIQARLREEALAVPDDEPTPDELNALPYLDNFVRELLRYDTPLPQVVRTAAVDCVVPLSKPVVGRNGELMSEIKVSKGTDFVVPINNMNRLEEIWGPDASEFNPDRFNNPAYPTVQLPGVWGGLLSFIGGPHHCLGYRFALLEIKAILFVMARHFNFEQLPTKPQFQRAAPGIVQRPVVIGEESKGIQMPVLVRRVEAE